MKVTSIYALHDPRDWAIRYVGKANNPYRRLRDHSNRACTRSMRRFIAELKSLGLSLRVSVLQECPQEDWQRWERFWIRTVRAAGAQLFNLTEGGNGVSVPWNAGKKLPEEMCRAMSRAHLGKKRSLEHRAKIAAGRRGVKVSEETRANMKAAQLGRKVSQEAREKISLALRGKKQSPEATAKRAASNTGKKRSLEQRIRMSNAQFGKEHGPWSEEARTNHEKSRCKFPNTEELK